ncbi:hypothetical protein GCM10022250_20130 [Flavobacterium chungbukense]|uniref:Transposase n=1 Tax=Flavobacterium chungbukense TaxID=877464 RepID=A0ABP7Y5A1_9FLAO
MKQLKNIKTPFFKTKKETPTATEPRITIKDFKVSVFIKVNACKAKPRKSKDGPTTTNGYKILGELLI